MSFLVKNHKFIYMTFYHSLMVPKKVIGYIYYINQWLIQSDTALIGINPSIVERNSSGYHQSYKQ